MSNNVESEQMAAEGDFERLVAQEMLIESATEKLLELMEREGVSKAELARRIGKSRPFITQVMDGSRNMTLRTVADLAFAIGYELRLDESVPVGIERTRRVARVHQVHPAPEDQARVHAWWRHDASTGTAVTVTRRSRATDWSRRETVRGGSSHSEGGLGELVAV